jgi:uncharacterized membrane protein required for colicin V production
VNWVDGVAIVILIAAAVRGYYAGAVTQVLIVVGIWAGLLAGVLLVPPLAGLVSGSARGFVAILVILACTISLGALGEVSGRRASRSLRRIHLGTADALVGVGVGVVAAMFAVWVLGTVLSASRYPRLNRALQESAVLRTADKVLPPLPELFARVESFLSSRGYPVVFVNFPPGLISPAELPDDSTLQAAFRVAEPSTVKIVGQACDVIETGSGFVAAPGLVVTNAHVVAGERYTQVIDRSTSREGAVVLFDPDLDVAILRVSGLTDPPLPVRAEPVARDTTGAIMGYPQGGSLKAAPAAVNAHMPATGLNIYGTAISNRSIYELNGDVQPGNSGGPLVATGQPAGTTGLAPGTVIGLIFARSTTADQVGYALTMDAVSTEIARAEQTSERVSTGACLP